MKLPFFLVVTLACSGVLAGCGSSQENDPAVNVAKPVGGSRPAAPGGAPGGNAPAAKSSTAPGEIKD